MSANQSDPLGVTHAWSGEDPNVTETDRSPTVPQAIGRYRVERLLGKGGFGSVFLATDADLQRPVAIKVPDPRFVSQPEQLELYLAEARMVAGLDHPHIVPVYDVGSCAEFPCYVVSRFVAGSDLSRAMMTARFRSTECAELVAILAGALHHAHTRGIVHRDIKPGNILLDSRSKPYLTDFGLALEEVNVGRGPEFAGTPAYMSPEQARGEGHRVDGRSDVFSLGVVLYELLTGRRPFRAEKRADLLDQIVTFEPRPPRQLDDSIPRELERICLKALAKRPSERYTTARDLADELRQAQLNPTLTAAGSPVPTSPRAFAPSTPGAMSVPGQPTPSPRADSPTPQGGSPQLGTAKSSVGEAKVVPKGLRSFDETDAEFFLELLPGARDREGLPTSIRFWKTKLETGDPDKTFAVGLLYGPSGCGKSSLVKAGIIPHLARHVIAVYVEATPDGTETRILAALRRSCPGLPEQGLVETLAALRRGDGVPAGRKIVLFIDQFEQWLHAQGGQDDTLLARALRQWDGARAQCVLMVRDDFWMSVTRFMHELEVRLIEGANSAVVDLFSPRHARKVLASFGFAFGALATDHEEGLTPPQREFLTQAVAGVTENGTVIPVRLALFAEMIKSRPWTTRSLKQAGGAGGIGAAFLEETFSASTAPPEHRFHQQAARNVLKALLHLPGQASGIKGHMRSREELLSLSGYARRPRDFDDLLRILDHELRLITPTEPDDQTLSLAKAASEPVASEASVAVSDVSTPRYYQLTHDYLVGSLRDWLTRKQRETRAGRAELRLEERSEVWNLKPGSDYLPGWWEVANISLLTQHRRWTAPERKMMRAAIRQQALRAALILCLLGLAAFGAWEANGRIRAATLVQQIVRADTARVPAIVKELSPYLRWGAPKLIQERGNVADESRERTNIALALLPSDPSLADYLLDRALQADPADFVVLSDELFAHRVKLVERLWRLLDDTTKPRELRIRAALLLAKFVPSADPAGDDLGKARWKNSAPYLASCLIETAVHDTARYEDVRRGLTPIGAELVPSLQDVYHDGKRPETDRRIAMNIVEQLASDGAATLADILVTSGERERFDRDLPALHAHRDEAVAFLNAQIAENVDQALRPNWSDPPLDPSWSEPDATSVRQIEAAEGLVHERFALCQTMPLAQFLTAAEHLRPSGYRPIKCRPFPSKQGSLVAAIWTRDTADWRLASGLSPEEVRQRQSDWKGDGLSLVDLAGYLDGDFRFAAVAARDPEVLEVDPVIGATNATVNTEFQARLQRGFQHVATQSGVDSAGNDRHSQVLVKTKSTMLRNSMSWFFPVTQEMFRMTIARADLPLAEVGVVAEASRRSAGGLFAPLVRVFHRAEPRYVFLQSSVPDRISISSNGLSPKKHLARARKLATDEHRPVAIGATELGVGQPIATVSAWHRPIVSENARDEFILRQIRAAAALLRLGAADAVWPLLRQQPDARLRAFAIESLPELGVAVSTLAARLDDEPDADVREAIILALGEYPPESLEATQREKLVLRLLSFFQHDPDSGVHSAADFLLRKLGQSEEVKRLNAILASSHPMNEHGWYVNGSGHTMAVIRGPVEFDMGAPHYEADKGWYERQHRRRIGRTFAIATTEVTYDKWKEFLADHPEIEHPQHQASATEPTKPVGSVTWYEAAKYCRWLSEREGFSEDEMCFPPVAEIKSGMQYDLEKPAYRLPTEAEWEFTCRAGTTTAYHFGGTKKLAAKYAWYSDNSAGTLHPVGLLKPNRVGLFDMNGNVDEWCLVSYQANYAPPIAASGTTDDRFSKLGPMQGPRVMRGGEVRSPLNDLRSANRKSIDPARRDMGNGFRLARTLSVSLKNIED